VQGFSLESGQPLNLRQAGARQQGRDGRLEEDFQVPRPTGDDGSAGDLARVRAVRLSWLPDQMQ
jgi:hypothetical protein